MLKNVLLLRKGAINMQSKSRLNEPHNLPGTLVCVEGIDGSGKSTQLAILSIF